MSGLLRAADTVNWTTEERAAYGAWLAADSTSDLGGIARRFCAELSTERERNSRAATLWRVLRDYAVDSKFSEIAAMQHHLAEKAAATATQESAPPPQAPVGRGYAVTAVGGPTTEHEHESQGKPFLLGSGGLLLLVSFFLPWLSVSCAGVRLVHVSGVDLAGRIAGASDPLLYLVPLAGLVALLAGVYLASKRPSRRGAGPGLALAGIAAVPVLLKLLGQAASQSNNPFASLVTISPEIGLFGVGLGILALAISTQAD